jgi:predicted  nucleic acid-binding Zn-ribbon protein
MKKRIDDRFTQMKHQINDEFEEMKKKMKKNMNERFIIVKKNIKDVRRDIAVFKQNVKNQFRAIEKSMNKHNDKMNNMNMKFRNNFIIINNDRIRRFHESIKIVKVFTIDSDLDKLK